MFNIDKREREGRRRKRRKKRKEKHTDVNEAVNQTHYSLMHIDYSTS
jgi:hypothetical protein